MTVSVKSVARWTGVCVAAALAVAPAAFAAPAPTIRTGDVDQYEGTKGIRTMSVPACISKVPSSGSASAQFTTVPGTAKAGSDFTSTSTRLTWEADDPKCRIVEVPVKADSRQEPDESFSVRLSDPEGARLGKATARAKIKDDDDPSEIVVSSAIFSINAWTTQFPFALSCPSDHPYVVFRTYSYYNYNAMYGLDMGRTSNSIAFFLPNYNSQPDPANPSASIVLTGMAAGVSGNLTTNNLTNYALDTENWQLHLHCTNDLNAAAILAQ